MNKKNLTPVIGGFILAIAAITAIRFFPDVRRYRRIKQM